MVKYGAKVIIMRGLPGSGKSHRVKQLLEKYPGAVVCSADHFFETDDGGYNFQPARLGEAHAACLHAFIRAVTGGADVVIVDNTNMQLWEIDNYTLLARLHGYDIDYIHMHGGVITREEIEQSIKRNVHGVPAHVIEAMAARWQW